jgi:hypothetical protein
MIKKVLLTIFVMNSCSFISYTEILPVIRSVVIGAEDIEINQSYIDSKEYSFAKIKIGRSSIAILSLAYIKDGVFEWVSSSNERIFTFNGKIIKTIGLPHNIDILDTYARQGFSSQTVLVALDNPNATVSQSLAYQSTVIEGQVIVEEQVIFNELNLDVTNTYIIDESNGRPVSSIQKVHPYLPVISLDFYYK